MRRFLLDFWIILGLFIIPLCFFLPVTLGSRSLIPADNLYQYEPWASYREQVGVPETPHNALLSDLVLQNYQWKAFIRENIRTREIPLWQPNQFAGTPFLATGQHSMLYPFSLIYYVLPLETAFGWFTVSQLWLAGLWIYVFIRGIGLGRIAGLVAALTLQLGNFYIVATVHPMIQAGAAWLPLLLLMVEYTIQRRPFPGAPGRPAMLPWSLIGAGALAMPHLAGHIEITYYTLLVTAFYATARLGLAWWQERHRWQIPATTAIVLAGMVVIGFGIGAVQFIPTVQAASTSFRTGRHDSLATVLSYALPPRHVAKWLMPDVYGNPAHHSYFDVFENKTVSVKEAWQQAVPARPDPPTDTDFGIKNYVEGGVYVGILPLILAAYGLYAAYDSRRKKQTLQYPPYRLIFVLLALVSLAFMFGTPLYAVLYYAFPGIDQLHTPFRWIWPLTVCIAVLAAFGAETLSQSRGEAEHGPNYFKTPVVRSSLYLLAKRGGWALIYVGALILMLLVTSRIFFDEAEPLVNRIYRSLAKAPERFPNVRSFYSYEFRNVLLLGLMVIAAGTVMRVSRCPIYVGKGQRRFPVWQVMAVAVIAIDLFTASFGFNPSVPKTWLSFTPPAVTWLQGKMHTEGPFRLQAYDWGEDPLHANAGWRYGLQDVRGYDSLFTGEYAAMLEQIGPQGLDFNRINAVWYNNAQALANPLLDLLNVRYIITDWLIRDEDNPAALGFEEVYVDAGVRIYRNVNALPRAYTAPLPANGDAYQFGERCSTMIRVSDLAHLKYIPPPSAACIPVEAATITEYKNTEVRIDAVVSEASWLVLADNYDSGWRAFVKPVGAADDKEKEVDIERVNLNLRGIRLDPGAWTVRFKYSPPAFQLGTFLSFIATMLVIFLALLWLWRTFVGITADESGDRRLVKNSVAPIVLNLFNRAIDFAFAFIMLRILGPANAGIYYYAIVVFGWFDIFTNFGLNTLLTRDVSRDRGAAGRYLYNTSLLRLGLAALGIPALALVLLVRNTTVQPPLDTTAVASILLLYIGLVPNSISTGITALFYAFEQAEYPAAMTTVSTLIKVMLGLGALLLGWGVVGLAAASIVTNFVTFLALTRLAWPLLRDHWEPVRNATLQRLMLREAWPLMINHLLATVFFKSDVILMEAINGVRVVGIYSTAYKWLDALNIIPAFFTMALLPVISRQAYDNRLAVRRHYLLGIKLLVLVALPTAVMTTFMATSLVGFLGGREFLPDGAISLQLMIWSIPIGWMNSLTQYVLIALDRQRQITWAFIIAVSFNMIANLIFLPAYSFRAAAIITIFSELVLFIGFFWLIRTLLGTINWIKLLWRLLIASGLAFGAMLVLWPAVPLLALMAGPTVYLGTLWWLQPFVPEETERLSRLLPGRLRRVLTRPTSRQVAEL